MKPITLQNYAEGRWVAGSGGMAELRSAVNGDVVALTSSQGLDFGAMLRFARERAVSPLHAMTFHNRAKMLKALAESLILNERHVREQDSRRAKNVPARIAPCPRVVAGRLKRGQIEPVVGGRIREVP